MKLSILLGVILALAQHAPAQQTAAEGPRAALAFPSGFLRAADDKLRNPALDDDWVEKIVDDAGLRIGIKYPSSWRVSDAPNRPLLQLIGLRGGVRFGVVTVMPVTPAPMSLNEDLPAEKLRQFSETLHYTVPGVEFKAVGQARVADRNWVWVDALQSAPKMTAPSGVPEGLFRVDPYHMWMFHTTVGDKMIGLGLSVLTPQGSAANTIAFDVHAASDVFLEMLKRVSFAPSEGTVRLNPSVVTPPRVVREVKPSYTAAAMRAKIAGGVLLDCVVEADGRVGEIRVLRSLDPVNGLDDEAAKAAKQWRFTPGMKDGMPVPVHVTIELTFILRDRAPAPPQH